MKKAIALLLVSMIAVVLISGCVTTEDPGEVGDVRIVIKAQELGANITIKMDDKTLYNLVVEKGETRELVEKNITNGTHTIDLYYGGALQERRNIKVEPGKEVKVEFILYDTR